MQNKCCGTPFVVLSLGRPRIQLTDSLFCWDVMLAFQRSSSSQKCSLTSTTLQVRGLVARASLSASDSSEDIRPICKASYIWPLFCSLTTFSLLSSFWKEVMNLLLSDLRTCKCSIFKQIITWWLLYYILCILILQSVLSRFCLDATACTIRFFGANFTCYVKKDNHKGPCAL